MKVCTRVEINAPASVVRETLLDFSGHAKWNPFFTSIVLFEHDGHDLSSQIKPGDRLEVTMKDIRSGKVNKFTPTVLANTVNKFEWEGSLIGQWFFSGIHTFEFQEENGGQKCILSQHETFSGVALPLLKPVLGGAQRNFEAMNNALKKACESQDKHK